MSRTIRISTTIAAAALLMSVAPVIGAQTRPVRQSESNRIAGPLSLNDAVERALRDDPAIRISAQAAEVALGLAISTHAAYDATVRTSVSHIRDNGLRVVTPTTSGVDPSIASALTSSVTSVLSAQQYLPWAGLTVSPQVSMTSAGTPGALAQSRATAALAVTVPLARDRGGMLQRSAEGAAYAEVDATGHDLRQASASGVFQVVTAYWAYVGAQRRLDVFIVAEDRAKRNLVQTTALVAADERPAADLVQLRGNVASKMSARISAEQAVLEAWRSLAALIGVGDLDIANTPKASTEFPALPAKSNIRPAASANETQALVNDALIRRADFAAASTRIHELEMSVRASDHLARPVIDVVAQFGYNGLEQGWGVQQFVSPLYRNRSPLNATVQLVYQFAAANTFAAGQARQAAAGLETQHESQRSIERSITTGVIVSIDGLRRSIQSSEASHLSTEAAQQTVDNELRKFRLGTSTVFDIILAEDNLTNALLGDVAGLQGYATAIARAQYEMGTLVTGERKVPTVNVAGLLQAPSIVATP
ncbi:MAG: TolC family protein [bacterium]